MMGTPEKNDIRSATHLVIGSAVVFSLVVLVWPALNVIVSDIIKESPPSDFLTSYEFFLKLN